MKQAISVYWNQQFCFIHVFLFIGLFTCSYPDSPVTQSIHDNQIYSLKYPKRMCMSTAPCFSPLSHQSCLHFNPEDMCIYKAHSASVRFKVLQMKHWKHRDKVQKKHHRRHFYVTETVVKEPEPHTCTPPYWFTVAITILLRHSNRWPAAFYIWIRSFWLWINNTANHCAFIYIWV